MVGCKDPVEGRYRSIVIGHPAPPFSAFALKKFKLPEEFQFFRDTRRFPWWAPPFFEWYSWTF